MIFENSKIFKMLVSTNVTLLIHVTWYGPHLPSKPTLLLPLKVALYIFSIDMNYGLLEYGFQIHGKLMTINLGI